MSEKPTHALIAALLTTGLAVPVQAATYGAEVGLSTISPCPSFCGGQGGQFDSAFDGGELATSAYQTLNNADGNGQASADLNGPAFLPVLAAEGFSGFDSRIGTSAVGMLGYTYTGAAVTSISLDVVLEGEIGGTTDPVDANVEANVAVVIGDISDYSTDYPTFRFEVLPSIPGATLADETNLSLDLALSGSQTMTDSLNFTLNPGDDFFVWAGLNAGGTRGGYGDAFSTLTMSFSDATGISATEVVPIPAAAWLFGSALLGVLGLTRRRSAA